MGSTLGPVVVGIFDGTLWKISSSCSERPT